MSVPVRDYLKIRKDRALGSILGHAERSDWWKTLDRNGKDALRHAVMDALGGYHDSVLDLVKAEDQTVVRNEEVITLLNRIDHHVRQGTHS